MEDRGILGGAAAMSKALLNCAERHSYVAVLFGPQRRNSLGDAICMLKNREITKFIIVARLERMALTVRLIREIISELGLAADLSENLLKKATETQIPLISETEEPQSGDATIIAQELTGNFNAMLLTETFEKSVKLRDLLLSTPLASDRIVTKIIPVVAY